LSGRYSIAVLIAANLLPLVGVLFWGWDVFFLLLLFWCENVIIGVFGIARLIVASDTENAGEGLFLPAFFLIHYGGFMFGHFMLLFFLIHYGGFMFGHFMLLFAMYSSHVAGAGQSAEPADYYSMVIENLNWIAVVALFISHGWSFVENYMGKREYENLRPGAAMALPYRRVMITHVALLAGGFFLVERGQPLVGLVLLVLLKIILDVTFHRREHSRLGPMRVFQP
jgi:hypothetical protein